jgi:serine/threonine protein phosphatase PrpC
VSDTSASARVNTACPNCGEPVDADDTFCEACGAQLGAATGAVVATDDNELGTHLLAPKKAEGTPLDSAPTTASMTPPAEVRHCSCGGVIDADGWCTTCGLRAPNERDRFTEQPAPNVAAVCDRGIVHARNEDAMALAVADQRVLMVVCDGVTSASDSDVASLAAARAARDALVSAPASPTDNLDDRVDHWQAQLNAATATAQAAAVAAAAATGATDNPPSCTYVAAVLDAPVLAVAWEGDSGAYWCGDDGVATQISIDDSWASGEIAHGVSRKVAEADARAHAITRWLGVDSPGGDPGFASMTVTGAGWILVCSDGLWNYCSEAAELRDLLREKAAAANGDPLAAADALVAWANEQGGHDNITAALARTESTEPTAPTGSE